MKKCCVVLVSGGMDSTTLFFKLLKERRYMSLIPVHFDYGQRNALFERICLQKQFSEVGVDLKFFDFCDLFREWYHHLRGVGNLDLYYEVPFRNFLFIAAACVVGQTELLKIHGNALRSESFDVAIAIHRHLTYNEYWDITCSFFERLKKLVSLSPYSVEVISPFVEQTKKEIYDEAKELGVNLRRTATCYAPRMGFSRGKYYFEPCDICESCIERRVVSGDPFVNRYRVYFTTDELQQAGGKNEFQV